MAIELIEACLPEIVIVSVDYLIVEIIYLARFGVCSYGVPPRIRIALSYTNTCNRWSRLSAVGGGSFLNHLLLNLSRPLLAIISVLQGGCRLSINDFSGNHKRDFVRCEMY